MRCNLSCKALSRVSTVIYILKSAVGFVTIVVTDGIKTFHYNFLQIFILVPVKSRELGVCCGIRAQRSSTWSIW